MSDKEHLRVVEINGVKVEVDLRTAKRVDQFKVGDPVKLLVKEYSNYESRAGVIVGFDEFKNLPTLIVACIKNSYNEVEMQFHYINAETKDKEIAPAKDFEQVIDYNKAMEFFQNKIDKQKRELEDVEAKRDWFVKNFQLYFKDFTKVKANND